MIRVALDTNVLAYLMGIASLREDKPKVLAAIDTLDRLASEARLVIPAQVLGELFTLTARRCKDREHSRLLVRQLAATYQIASSDTVCALEGADLAADSQLQYWDALILSVAAAAGCVLFLSEDLQDGFTHRGMTVANPFAETLNPRLAALLGP